MRRRPRGLRLARSGLVGVSAAGFTGIVAGLGPLNAQSTTGMLDVAASKSIGEPVDAPLALGSANPMADERGVENLRRPTEPLPVLPERTDDERAGQLILPPQLTETATTSSTSSSTTTDAPTTTAAPTTTRTAPKTTTQPAATQPAATQPAATQPPATTSAAPPADAPTTAPTTQAPPTTQTPTTPAPTTAQPPASTTTTIATSTTSTTLPPLVGGS